MPTMSNNGNGLLVAPERNHFFYGKLMDVDQFQKDQCYFNEKRWLLNRLSLGSGVLCGLDVVADADGKVRIQPGIAVDGLGREIVLPEPGITVNPRQLTDDQGNHTGAPIDDGDVNICLGYAETLIDPVPVLVADCDTHGNCAPSTVREGFRILIRLAEEEPSEPPTCNLGEFPLPAGATLQKLLSQRISQPCPVSPGEPCVPLARVTVSPGAGGINSITSRKLVIANPLLYELVLCLAERIEGIAQGRVLRYVSGDGQTGEPDSVLAKPLEVQLVDGEGNPIRDQIVQFEVTDGGEVIPASPQTNEQGHASAKWTLGSSGEQKVIASAVGTAFTVTYQATAAAP